MNTSGLFIKQNKNNAFTSIIPSNVNYRVMKQRTRDKVRNETMEGEPFWPNGGGNDKMERKKI